MFTLLKVEIIKIRKSIPLKIMGLLMLVLSFITAFSSLSYLDSPMGEMLEIAFYGHDAFYSSLKDTPTISALSMITIALVVCGDFENRTLPMEIAMGYSRVQILFSKLIAVAIANILVFFPYPIGRTILQSIFVGFGYPITTTAIMKMIAVLLVVIMVGIAICGITLVFSFTLKKTVLVMGISFLFIILGGNALLSFGISTPSIGAFLAHTPIGLLKEMAIAQYTPPIVLKSFIISILYIVLSGVLTFFLFNKADLK